MSDATSLAADRPAIEATGPATEPAVSGLTAPSRPVAATLFDTAIGRCAIAWSGAGVIRFQLPEGSPAATRARITRAHAGQKLPEEPPTAAIAEAIAGIRAHLAGELDDLRWIAVDTSGIPEFHRAVYAVTRAIDPGHTLSYGQVAHRVGAPGAAQAVGQALGRNPIPLIIPCHRVLAADHALHGFSAPGGIDTKQRLLTIERTPGFGEPTLF
ncbi:methylated-DNA--[protein]-cysteine S-methyltransferase [Nocardia niwae]|uniref:methylated-DNA--[protein]-cysteine S-methyltransferase n=1 Tax=Nocardia niwae TaxID=626084 RepID=UPI000A062060|nr:MGMT family protein [Nocardia niwae]